MKWIPPIIAIVCFSLLGCHILFQHTSLEVDVYRPPKTEHITASAAMQAWNTYVLAKHPSPEKEKQVQAAFDQYHQAQLVLMDVIKTTSTNSVATGQDRIDAAIASSSAALTDLIRLIRRSGVKL